MQYVKNYYDKNGFIIKKNILSKKNINAILKMTSFNLNLFKNDKTKILIICHGLIKNLLKN